MAVQWGLAQPQGGGFDYLDSLQAIGQQQLQQQAIQQRQYALGQQQRQDETRQRLAGDVRAGNLTGARREALLSGDFDFAGGLNALSDDDARQAQVGLDAIGSLRDQLRAVPIEQRAALAVPILTRAGVPAESLSGFDFSDASLDGVYTLSRQGQAMLASRIKAAEPRVVGDGGALVDGSGNVLYENQREEKPIWDSEGGNLIYPSRYGGGGTSTAPPASGGGSRAARNNNPGNIIDSAFARSQPGYQGSDGRFARFASADAGTAAQGALLGSYIDRGFNTVEKIINRWAPPSENDTGSYVRNVARALNVDPRQPLSKASIPALQQIITRVEGGPGGSSAGGNRPASAPGVVNVRAPKARDRNAPSGYRYNGDRLEPIPGGPADPATSTNRSVQSNRKAESDFRKEFHQLQDVKDFTKARTQFNSLRAIATNPKTTAQDDLAVIFSFMKTLDPTSTVREGEFATAQNAAGVPENIRNAFNKAQNGERLSPQQRTNMVRTAYQGYKAYRDAYNQQAENYRGYARDNGINPDRVARTYTPDKPARSQPIKVGQSSKIGGFTVTRVK